MRTTFAVNMLREMARERRACQALWPRIQGFQYRATWSTSPIPMPASSRQYCSAWYGKPT